ncbi:MAG TPA: energy-coupling factor transporter transmembrane component T [Candidatus Sulfomarinibacteraceae bacterium]|nr:energy-coupling factor transporter transmembrane component T [Candidatus Sulfomarinibacteraceae bacterium]
MIGLRQWQATTDMKKGRWQPGTVGSLILFVWSLALVFVTPLPRLWIAGLLALLAAVLLYPQSLRRLLQPRWLLLLGLMSVPSLFLPGRPLLALGPLTLTAEGVQGAWQMLLRATVILAAVDGFTASVSVSEMAGLFERAGLRGLGFATGVALNLLPILRDSIAITWHSLRMRGGFRRHRLRATRYFLVTVVAGAVQRAEEIALAAEARAYSPDGGRASPLRHGAVDPYLLLACVALLLALRLWP